MNRYFSLLTVIGSLVLLLNGCTPEPHFTEGVLAVNGWCSAVKNLDYQQYCRHALAVRDYQQFAQMYNDYYFDQLTVTGFDEAEREIADTADNGILFARSIRFDAVTVDRKTMAVRGNVSGEFELVRKKDSTAWLVASKTILHRD
jgi:hypothetical protein